MELANESFEDVLEKLKNPTGNHRRDPRSIRRAAVTSAIVDNIDDVSASKVYARAVTALEGSLTSTNASVDTIGTQISILELLSLTVPHVEPRSMLNATLPLTSRVLRAVVSTGGMETTTETNDELGGMNALLRQTCKASTAILSNLSAKSLDEVEVKQFLCGSLLALFEDRRPKVRRTAHASVVEMLMSTTRAPKLVALTSSFVHSQLKNTLLAVAKEDPDSFKSLSHMLAFLAGCIQHLNFPLLFSDVMEVFAVLMKNQQSNTSATDFVVSNRKIKDSSPNLMIISSILTIGLNLLGDEDQGREAKVDEIASRILASLLQAKPSLVFVMAETSLLQSVKMQYGRLIIAACNRLLAETSLDVAIKLLPLAVQMLMNLSLPEDGDPEVAQNLMVELTQLFRMKLHMLQGHATCLAAMMQRMQVLVKDPAHRPTWSVSLKCYVVLASFVPTMLNAVLKSLVEVRTDAKRGAQFAVEDALSTLIQTIGTEKVWNSMQWNSPSKSEGVAADRTWVFANMKNAATIAQPVPPRLEFFRTEILALARTCDRLAATKDGSEKNFHRGCVISAWALFPSFCHSPTDIESEILPLSDTLCRALGDKRYPELLPTICNGLVHLTNAFEEKGGLELDEALGEKQAFSSAAKKILPTLFKFVTDAHAAVSAERTNASKGMEIENEEKQAGNAVDGFQKLKCVSEVISVLARLAERDFLDSLFKTVMQRLLEEIQSDSGDSERICALLTLSQALVTSQVLTEDSLNFLYRALKPLIRNDETTPRVQKRAYKVLYELCERHTSFVTAESSRLKELIGLLTGTIMTSQISARHMRLKCMNSIVSGLGRTDESKLTNLNEVVPEVLLCLKDSNAKTRDAAYNLLLSMALQENLVGFVNVILAALGAKTTHMRSAVVLALSRLVFEHARENDELKELLPRLLQTILVLVNEGSREVLKSVVGFVRICVSAIPPEQLQPLVPELLGALLESQQAKSRFRAKIKIILKKLVKLFGYEALMESVPQSETRLLTHMRKLDEREKRKRLSARSDAESRVGDFENMVESDEEDSDDGMTFVTGATGLLSKKSRKTMSDAKSISSKQSRRSQANTLAERGVRLPDEDNGEVVDMLGPNMSKRVHFAADESSDDDSDGAMEFDDDGRMIVHDDDEPMQIGDAEDSDVRNLEGLRKKRGLDKKQSSSNGGSPKKRKVGLGSSYQSRKAGGDVKRKGQKYEPYAFVPLDGRAFAKKNRRTAVDQMSTVVRGKGSKKRK